VDDIRWLNTSPTAVQSMSVWLARHKSERPSMVDLEFLIERVSRLPTPKEQALKPSYVMVESARFYRLGGAGDGGPRSAALFHKGVACAVCTGATANSAFLLNAPLPRGEMWLDLTDEETLLNLLPAITTHPDPPRHPAKFGPMARPPRPRAQPRTPS
jgi:hypothetical protein